MTVLYVTEPGTVVSMNEGQVVIETKSGLKKYIPIETLENVVLFGPSHITTNCHISFLTRGINITYLSSSGNFFGRTESTKHINIYRQRSQFKLGENEGFCIEFTRRILYAKINNQKVLLRRYNRYRNIESVTKSIDEIDIFLDKISKANSIEQMMGYEGNASKVYFKSLGQLVNSNFKFYNRSKMPPRDPFNAMLSLGYTLLLYEIYTAISLKGLNPYAGFMHKDKQGHPALASDMIEEWRPVIVDSLVMKLILNNDILLNDFYNDGDAVLLTKSGLKKFIQSFEKKMLDEINYLGEYDEDNEMNFRRTLLFQANLLSKSIDNNDFSLYKPIHMRW